MARLLLVGVLKPSKNKMIDLKTKPGTVKKNVALMQPTFMPWQGYFGLILDSDEFVFLDDFQFVRRSFHQRNRLFLNGSEAGYISVSVEHSGNQDTAINQVSIQIDDKWRRKFLGILKHNYKASPYLSHYHDFVEDWISQDFENLAHFNIHFIEFVMNELKIVTPTLRSSDILASGKRSEKLLNILKNQNATTYLSAFGAYEYMAEDDIFSNQDIEFVFQNYQPVPYSQTQSQEFVSHLSILDALLQHGPEKTLSIIQKSSGHFLSEQEMKAV